MTPDNNSLSREKITIDGQERDVLPKDTLLNNRYQINRVLGHGSMGAVYLGIDKNFGERVAIKENLYLTDVGRQDFESESTLLFRLKNDHLPRVFDRFEADGRQYLVMDFVDGQNLYELIRPDTAKPAAPLPLPQALDYIIQACAAVEYLHRQKPPIVHHDIKPQNIKVTPAGEVILVDFGLAKEGTAAGGQGLTFGFAPPEQYTGRTATTPASDLYALGATLYALVTGLRPPDSLQLVSGQADLKPAHEVNSEVSPQLSETIAQAMRIKPADRPASVAAWRARLQAIMAEIAAADPPLKEQEPATTMPDTAELPAKASQGQDIFISYSRRDEAFIRQLYGDLTTRGLSAWYDRFDIPVGCQWATEIVEGIKNCRVFLLVLSPDSAASPNVRKEVDLAQRYNKQIVPLIWRTTEIPVAMEYQLAGIQWIEFKEDQSPDKFSQLAAVLERLLGGASMTEAAGSAAIAKESIIRPIEEPAGAGETKPKLGGLKKKQTVSPLSLGGSVISGVVVTFGLDSADQDFVNTELKWLFSAADNFQKIRRGDLTPTQPIAVAIPTTAQLEPGANNSLLTSIDSFSLQIWDGQIDSAFKRIQIHLRNLDILLEQETKKGDAGKGDVYLQNQIKGARLEIVKILQELAGLMKEAYGVFVDSPNQLIELLG